MESSKDKFLRGLVEHSVEFYNFWSNKTIEQLDDKLFSLRKELNTIGCDLEKNVKLLVDIYHIGFIKSEK